MKKIKNSVLPLVVLVIALAVSSYTENLSIFPNEGPVPAADDEQKQTVNMFVTHGHCSTPFAGIVDDLNVNVPTGDYLGNPLEDMNISFEINPKSFNVCAGDDLTARIRTPGLFIGENDEKITFRSTDIYTMGIDWYQVNGKMSIKGVEKDVKFFVTGIRNPKDTMASSLVLEGQVNLLDWGIDYDKIVSGISDPNPTKWMHINMKIDMC